MLQNLTFLSVKILTNCEKFGSGGFVITANNILHLNKSLKTGIQIISFVGSIFSVKVTRKSVAFLIKNYYAFNRKLFEEIFRNRKGVTSNSRIDKPFLFDKCSRI